MKTHHVIPFILSNLPLDTADWLITHWNLIDIEIINWCARNIGRWPTCSLVSQLWRLNDKSAFIYTSNYVCRLNIRKCPISFRNLAKLVDIRFRIDKLFMSESHNRVCGINIYGRWYEKKSKWDTGLGALPKLEGPALDRNTKNLIFD